MAIQQACWVCYKCVVCNDAISTALVCGMTHSKMIKQSIKENIKITIDFSENINTLCCAILLGEKKLDYDILHERITDSV